MSRDDLAKRLDTVEQRLDAAYPEPAADAVDSESIERIETVAERLADLEAAVEAVEGYVGEIERVDGELEQRADAALAAADGAEERVDAVEERLEAVGERLDAIEHEPSGARRATDRRGDADENGPDEPSAETTRSGLDPDRDQRHRCDCETSGVANVPDPPRRSATPDASVTEERFEPDEWNATAVDRSRGAGDPVDRSRGARSSGATLAGSQAANGPGARSRAADDRGSTPRSTGGRDGSRAVPVGRAYGGQPGGTHDGSDSLGGSTISGWGGPVAEPAPARRHATNAHDGERDDGSWGTQSTETLLDRLRSML